MPTRRLVAAFVVAAVALLGAKTARAELTQSTTVRIEQLQTVTASWSPARPGSSGAASRGVTTRRAITVSLRTAPARTAGATLPLFVCRGGKVARTSIRPAPGATDVLYTSTVTRSSGEFFANDPGCLGTGAEGKLLGYVVRPSEARAYVARFGGTLDPLVTCARHVEVETKAFGDKDYVLDGEACEKPVFAGFTVGFALAETSTPAQVRPADEVAALPLPRRLVAGEGRSLRIVSALEGRAVPASCDASGARSTSALSSSTSLLNAPLTSEGACTLTDALRELSL